MDTIFQISNLLVMPFWFMMIFLPLWSWTRRIIASIWIVVPVALLYVSLVAPALPALLGELMNPQLDAIVSLLGTPEGATIGWVHFLAFDLFVGRWAYLDSRKRTLPVWLASPVLFFILMFGPLGLLLYLITRSFHAYTQSPQA